MESSHPPIPFDQQSLVALFFLLPVPVRARICPSDIKVLDAETLVRRHFKAVMDEYDMLPSQTCAEDVIMRIFMERFPCPLEGKPT